MYTRDLIIRCYAERKGDIWVAVCADFPLAAQSDTVESAVEKLRAQILDYITEIYSENQYTASMLSRKAPLAHKAKYYLYAALSALHLIKESLARSFESPLPMKPCH